MDGSASNDGAHLLGEACQALLLARLARAGEAHGVGDDGRPRYGCDHGPAEMNARQMLAVATRGGARVLGRSDIGQLSPGVDAAIAIYDMNTVVNGRIVAREGRLTTRDPGVLIERHNRLARRLAAG